MRKASVFLVALVVALAAAAPLGEPLFAQDAAQQKAADVLAKMREAIGGGKLDSLRTFSLEAKSAMNMGERQMVRDLELYLELPDKYLRVDNITAPIARTMTSGHNGEKLIQPQGNAAGGAPMVFSMPAGGGGSMVGQRMVVTEMAVAGAARGGGPGGADANVTPEMRAAQTIRNQRTELSRMMLGWFGMAHPGLKPVYTYAGEAESPDGKAHIVLVKADGGFEARLFIDQATNMPLMVSWQAFEPIRMQNNVAPGGTPPTQEEMRKQLDEAMKNRKMIEYRTYFADWKEVGGIQFPHTLQRATGSETTEEWTISKVSVNPKLDSKKFQ